MNNRTLRHILLCLAGKTPQVVTETLYVLTQVERDTVDEIRVITTEAGRKQIADDLFADGQGKFYQFCRDFGIDAATIRFDMTSIILLQAPDGRVLDDIRTKRENEWAADHISRIVQELTQDVHARIHASVAGGRKTMGIYMTAAMQLFGRPQDRLSHILVSEPFESVTDFFYKPPVAKQLKTRSGTTVSTADAVLDLADIDFIRLRGVMPDRPHNLAQNSEQSYGTLVKGAQDNLNFLELAHELRLNLQRKIVAVADRSAKLTKREFFFYLLFAYLRKRNRGENGYVRLEKIQRDDYDQVLRLVTRANGDECGLEECQSINYKFLCKFVDEEDPQDIYETFRTINSKIKERFLAAKLPERYFINNIGSYGESRYGIDISPDRITWF